MEHTFKAVLAGLLCLVIAPTWAGVTQKNDPKANTPSDSSDGCQCGSSKGMPVYSFKSLLASLRIRDTPAGYAPPVGPKVFTTITYNQREANQPKQFNFSNLGPKWTFTWLTWIRDDPRSPGSRVLRYVAGGGARSYGGYNYATGKFSPEHDNGAVLVMTSRNPVTYELRFADGAKDVFSASDGATTYPRRVLLTRIVDPHGNALSLNYDNSLRLTSVSDAVGQQTTFQYGDANDSLLVTGITDPFGRHASLTYDAKGRLSGITDTIGMTSTFAYEAGTFVKAMTTPYGTTTFQHTEGAHGNRTELSIQARDPDGHTERTEYLPDAPGTPFSFSRAPNRMYIFNSFQNYRDSYYWDKDQFAAACSTNGTTTNCDYSKARMKHFMHVNPCCYYTSRVLEDVKYPLESTIWYDYAGQARPLYPGKLDKPSDVGRVLDDGTSQVTHYDYNAHGKVTRRVDPDGRETDYKYAADGIDLLQVQQKTGSGYDAIARYTYNNQHQPLSYTDAAGQTTNYTYNSRGQRTSATDAAGNTTRYRYDGNGYLTTVINAFGDTQHSYTYDAYGRVVSDTDSQGYTRRYRYDALDRITQISYPDGTHKTYTWDKLDLASATDRLGNTTRYSYDAERNLIKVTDAMGQATLYTYYPNGRLRTMTDPNGNVTTWVRDLEGRVTAKTYADGNGASYEYDTSSRLSKMTDALGQITAYSYDRADLLTGIDYANTVNATPAVTFAYDSNYRRLTAMTDGHGTTAFSYYPAGVLGGGRLKSEHGDDPHDSVQYSYGPLGRPVKRTVDGTTNTFAYDSIGRLVADRNSLGDFAISYRGDTVQPTKRTVAGVPFQVSYQYESNLGDRRLKAILNDIVSGNTPSPVADYTFTSNANGLYLSRTVNDGLRHNRRHHDRHQGRHHGWAHAPHWGALARLFGTADRDDQQRSEEGKRHAHDDDRGREDDAQERRGQRRSPGNTTQYTYDPDWRLTAARGVVNEDYVYDPAGNLTDVTAAGVTKSFGINDLNQAISAGTDNYTYDADGNLIDDGVHTYAWDAAGNLIKVTDTVTGNTSEFAYDGFGRRVTDKETDQTGVSTVTRFLWCGVRLCEHRDATGAVSGRYYPEGEFRNGQSLYYAQDQIGSVTALVDASARTVGRVSYGSYGNIISSNGTMPDFGYAGLYHHRASGLYLAIYRAFSATARRWIARDPLEEVGGLNVYRYVHDNPVNWVDPLGLLDRLVFNGSSLTGYDDFAKEFSVPATSGPWGKGPLPNGVYNGGNLRAPRNKKGMTCSDGASWSLNLSPTFQTSRTNLEIHPDGNVPGTLGCIGVSCHAQAKVYKALKRYFSQPGATSIPVIVNHP